MDQSAPGKRTNDIACSVCKRRKTKCSGGRPCVYCAKQNTICQYDERPTRTPLTRRNMDILEERCERLETMLKTARLGVAADCSPIDGSITHAHCVDQYTSENDMQVPPGDDDVAEDPEVYEWHESPLCDTTSDEATDGMASLTTDPSVHGYLGKSSGSSMLRTVHKLLLRKSPTGRPQDPQSAASSSSERHRNRSISPVSSLNPIVEDLTSSFITGQLIDAYFWLYNPLYPIVHERSFREQYKQRNSLPDSSTWYTMFYMILALGAFSSSTTPNDSDLAFYRTARQHMTIRTLEGGTFVTVQGLLLMGNYIQKRNRPNTGYILVGIAFRMAIGLGLHRELSHNSNENSTGDKNTMGQEFRRRIWWILYMLDTGLCITMGRPAPLPESMIDARFPLNIDDSSMRWSELKTTPVPLETNIPTIYSSMLAQARLALIANRFHNHFLAPARRTLDDNLKVARVLDGHLATWKESLPAYFYHDNVPSWFRGPRAVLFWREQNLKMMFHRGFIPEVISQETSTSSTLGGGGAASPLESAVQTCLSTALETVVSISSFCDTADVLRQGLVWYATYFLFQAILILDIAILRTTHHPNLHAWRSAWERGRRCLRLLGDTSSAATRCLTLLDRIHNGESTGEGNGGARGGNEQYEASFRTAPSESDNSSSNANLSARHISDPIDRTQEAAHLGLVDPALYAFADNNTPAAFYDVAGVGFGAVGVNGMSYVGDVHGNFLNIDYFNP